MAHKLEILQYTHSKKAHLTFLHIKQFYNFFKNKIHINVAINIIICINNYYFSKSAPTKNIKFIEICKNRYTFLFQI